MKICIKDLKKTFNEKTAVDVLHLEISNGDILGLVGNNGAGKTTLFRLILDLLKADSGNVVMTFDTPMDTDSVATEDINPAESETWKKFTGAYIDEGFLIDFLTPEEFFGFIGKTNNMSDEEIKARLEDFAQFMNGEIMGQKKYIREFSAGNKQKIGIIAAMLNKPQLLILDEPFNFLDPSSQNVLKKEITDYNKETGATILISSHNLQHTTDISTRIALLEHGQIIKDMQGENSDFEKELEDYFQV
ncbi:MAG: ABC transporter ATP-binding protein [Prevotella sp.]